MPLKTLLERFVRGLPLPSASGYGEAMYYGEDEDYMINPATLDIAEKHEFIRNNKNRIHDIQTELTDQQEREKERLEREKQASQKSAQKVEANETAVQQ